MEFLPADRIWVNPDCGLKTRGWSEVHAALKNMVTAAISMRDDNQITAPKDTPWQNLSFPVN